MFLGKSAKVFTPYKSFTTLEAKFAAANDPPVPINIQLFNFSNEILLNLFFASLFTAFNILVSKLLTLIVYLLGSFLSCKIKFSHVQRLSSCFTLYNLCKCPLAPICFTTFCVNFVALLNALSI